MPLPVRRSVAMVLLGAGVVAAFTGAVVLAYASLSPAVLGTRDEAPVPGGWVTPLWVIVAVFGCLLAGAQHRIVPWGARVGVGSALVAVSGLSMLFAQRTIPTPVIGLGVGPKLPLTIAGCVVGVLAGLLYLVGLMLVRDVDGPLVALPTAVTAVAVVLVLVATTLVGVQVADEWTDQANTAQSVAAEPLGPQRPTTFRGGARWQQDIGQWTASAGGLVGQLGPGIVAVDPSTGKPRWRYSRWGMSFFGRPVASPDGRLVAVAATNESSVRRFAAGGASNSQIFVFDSRRGELLTRFAAAGDTPLAVRDDMVVTGQPTGRFLAEVTGYRFDGARAWRYRGHQGCALTGLVAAGDGVVVSCGRVSGQVASPGWGWVGALVRLDLETGEPRWRWTDKRHVPADNGLVYHDGTLFVSAPHTAEHSRQLVAALDAKTGRVRWQHYRYMVGEHPPGGTYSYTAEYSRAGGFVVAGTAPVKGGGEEVRLTSFAASDGTEQWRREERFPRALNDHQDLPTLDRRGLAESVEPAGRSIVVLGSGEPTPGGYPLLVRVVDAATGRGSDALRLSPKDVPYRLHGSVYAVSGSVSVTAEVAGAETAAVTVGLK